MYPTQIGRIVGAPNELGEIRRDFPFFQHFRFCFLV